MKNNILLIFFLIQMTSCFNSQNRNTTTNQLNDDEIEALVSNTELYILGSETIPNSNYQFFPITNVLEKGFNYKSNKGGSRNVNDLVFINIKTREKHLLFDSIPCLISEYSYQNQYDYISDYERELINTQKKKDGYIFITAKTEDFNGNNILDYKDPDGLYYCDSSGKNLNRISPFGLDVDNWKFIDGDKKIIELRCRMDINSNGEFDYDDDQKVFFVELDSMEYYIYDIFDDNFKDELKRNFIENR